MKDMNNFSSNSKKIIRNAKKHAIKNSMDAITTYDLFVSLVTTKDTFAYDILSKSGIDEKDVINLSNEKIPKLKLENIDIKESPLLEKVYNVAKEISIKCKSLTVGTHHLLIALLVLDDGYSRYFLNKLKINAEELLYDIFAVYPDDYQVELVLQDLAEIHNRAITTENKTLETLNKFGTNMNKLAIQNKYDNIIGREEEIIHIAEILTRKKKNNVCLVGEPGVGKTAIVEGLALLITQGKVPEVLKNKVIYSIDFTSIISGTKYRGEFEERMKNLIDEITQFDNIILFIDEIHTMIGAGAGENTLDAANILKPALSRGEIQLIGATTINEYKKHIESDGALERRFKPLFVNEPSTKDTVEILKGLKTTYEKFHDLEISDELVEKAVYLTDRYVTDRFLPDKAIDLIDESCSSFNINNNINNKIQIKEEELFRDYNDKNHKNKNWISILQEENETQENKKSTLKLDLNTLNKTLSKWTKIPVNDLNYEDLKNLKNLSNRLKKHIIGQENAIDTITRSIKRAKVGISKANRPLGTFLFCGPTGVGKTELAKVLSNEIFVSDNNLITVNMTEYMESHSVSKIIGSPPGYVGYGEGGQLTEKVRNNPHSIILFDEIEKAHPDIYNILLQILDEGELTDAKGRKINFRNTIIIMTSNIGSYKLANKTNLGFNTLNNIEYEKSDMQKVINKEIKKIFKPEFLNRLDNIIIFNKLTDEDIKKILSNLLNEFIIFIKNNKNIKLSITSGAKGILCNKIKENDLGARPVKRIIQENIEDKITDILIDMYEEKITEIICKKSKDKLVFMVDNKLYEFV